MSSEGRRVVALRHVHFEDLGTLADVLAGFAASITYIDVPRAGIDLDAIREADLLVALGGPVSVYDEPRYPWIADELRALHARLESGRALLGICLGSQMIARALGARVYAGPEREIGWGPLTLTPAGHSSVIEPLGGGTPMFHWHGDTFELPAGTVRLASTALYDNQVYACGASTLAFQCHPEIDGPRIEEWLVGHAAELAAAGVDVVALRNTTLTQAPALAKGSRRMFDGWLRSLGWHDGAD